MEDKTCSLQAVPKSLQFFLSQIGPIGKPVSWETRGNCGYICAFLHKAIVLASLNDFDIVNVIMPVNTEIDRSCFFDDQNSTSRNSHASVVMPVFVVLILRMYLP